MRAGSSSETLVSVYQYTWRHIPQDNILQLACCVYKLIFKKKLSYNLSVVIFATTLFINEHVFFRPLEKMSFLTVWPRASLSAALLSQIGKVDVIIILERSAPKQSFNSHGSWSNSMLFASSHSIRTCPIYKSNETPTWCNTVQVLFLQSHLYMFRAQAPIIRSI